MRPTRTTNNPLIATFILLLGCTTLLACGPSTEEHNAVLNELEATRVQLGECQTDRNALEARLTTATEELSHMTTRAESCEDRLAEAVDRVEAYASESRRRDAIYEALVTELEDMIAAGQLDIRIEDGRLVLDLPNDVLFESGEASLNEEGRQALTTIATALSRYAERDFQVEGHTDDVPISTARFDDNWELSTARALTVVDLLVAEGVSPDQLSAAGYGEFDPEAPNSTPEGRQQNRRVEIVMLPNLERLRDIQAGGREAGDGQS